MICRLRESDILSMAGTDAIVFLELLRLSAKILTVVAIPLCIILIPIDVTYQVSQQNASKNINQTNSAEVLYLTMGMMQGAEQWAHVVLSYLAMSVSLFLIHRSYLKVIQIRHAYFTSPEYESSFYSRALLITDIAPHIHNSNSLRFALEKLQPPYPLREVELGNSTQNLAQLLKLQKSLVYRLERAIDKTLRSSSGERVTIKVGGTRLNWCSTRRVDAIDYYKGELSCVESQIQDIRSGSGEKIPETYGFASVSAPMYAHDSARYFTAKQPSDFHIRLASSPRDIIWENLDKSKVARMRSRVFARFLLVSLFCINILPLLISALISNLDAFRYISNGLRDWIYSNVFSFSVIKGIIPPLITYVFSLLLPKMMHRIVMYRGVRTKQSRDVLLTGQYFTFTILTQFFIFSLISVLLDLVLIIIKSVRHNESAGDVASSAAKELASSISIRFQFLSAYWMTWIVLKGYFLVFELAQVLRFFFLVMNKYIFPHTPRDVWELTKPPNFCYWVSYVDMLFIAVIGFIYAPLSPIVTAFAAGVFWMALFVFKNQFYFVYATKSESGGRLWSVATRCLLAGLALAQVVLAVAIGLLHNWVKAIVCVPPLLALIAYGIYTRIKLEPRFTWYDPSPLELARTVPLKAKNQYQPLMRQFGHPLLHDPLYIPVVNAKFMDRVHELYDGPVISSKSVLPLALPRGPRTPIYNTLRGSKSSISCEDGKESINSSAKVSMDQMDCEDVELSDMSMKCEGASVYPNNIPLSSSDHIAHQYVHIPVNPSSMPKADDYSLHSDTLKPPDMYSLPISRHEDTSHEFLLPAIEDETERQEEDYIALYMSDPVEPPSTHSHAVAVTRGKPARPLPTPPIQPT